jgi:hypothetical protein
MVTVANYLLYPILIEYAFFRKESFYGTSGCLAGHEVIPIQMLVATQSGIGLLRASIRIIEPK